MNELTNTLYELLKEHNIAPKVFESVFNGINKLETELRNTKDERHVFFELAKIKDMRIKKIQNLINDTNYDPENCYTTCKLIKQLVNES